MFEMLRAPVYRVEPIDLFLYHGAVQTNGN
jgi:hypothetical protein